MFYFYAIIYTDLLRVCCIFCTERRVSSSTSCNVGALLQLGNSQFIFCRLFRNLRLCLLLFLYLLFIFYSDIYITYLHVRLEQDAQLVINILWLLLCLCSFSRLFMNIVYLVTLLWTHAQRCVHVIFCRCFFYIFFIPALVGQTAEQIFTKLSHVVDIRCYLRTY